ncbi:hypothetical protein CDD83_7849 [Cordyceps sp. RAO-2017]|nr:hypothetical protein CDD83_7849 [Cordyceps sp. RAO-2017]
MKKHKKNGGSSSNRIADARFANFETDPRFRLPSKKRTKTTIDKRFAGMLKDEEFIASAKVDRYGRKIRSDSKKKALERLYQAEEDEADDTGRGADKDDAGEDGVDDDELVQRELRAAHEKATQKKYDPARGGGFSSSESDSDSDDNSEDEEDEDDEDGRAGLVSHRDMPQFQDEQAEVESGEVTNRLAIVNLDWDHVKSADLMALFSSFIPPNCGRILKISIYPSEFGKERMQQEEVEGPPKALFKDEPNAGSDSDESSDDSDGEDEKIKQELMAEGDDQDFDSDALRSYQLDRLRYYYAIMVCSSRETASKVYEATDGTEYQSSSNVIDLRFVPDDVTFDDEARDECDKVPDSYKPVDFVTNALQSSKVKLTWDMHPEEASRKDSIKRAFSGSRAELEENDLRAYLASGSDSEDGEGEAEDDDGDEDEAGEGKMTKKELARKKMREALGLGDGTAAKSSKDGPVGEMQITFGPALGGSEAKEPEQEETTIEKYKRKERERKEKKRQTAKAKRDDAPGSGDEERAGEKSGDKQGEKREEKREDQEDLGFDDPFFTADDPAQAPSKTSLRKEERLRRREARQAAEAESAAQQAQLSKVMGEEGSKEDRLDHFDMREIVRAEKAEGKKAKRKKKQQQQQGPGEGRGGLQQGFEMDVEDDRFKAVFDSHEFAIDPSNPRYQATGGMKRLLEEVRSKKHKVGDEDQAREEGGKARTEAKSKRAKKAR